MKTKTTYGTLATAWRPDKEPAAHTGYFDSRPLKDPTRTLEPLSKQSVIDELKAILNQAERERDAAVAEKNDVVTSIPQMLRVSAQRVATLTNERDVSRHASQMNLAEAERQLKRAEKAEAELARLKRILSSGSGEKK